MNKFILIPQQEGKPETWLSVNKVVSVQAVQPNGFLGGFVTPVGCFSEIRTTEDAGTSSPGFFSTASPAEIIALIASTK